MALFLDGKSFADEEILIALGVTLDGHKIPLGFVQAATENERVCRRFLSDLVERGLQYEAGLLVVLDGGKGLYKAVRSVLKRACLRAALPVSQAPEPSRAASGNHEDLCIFTSKAVRLASRPFRPHQTPTIQGNPVRREGHTSYGTSRFEDNSILSGSGPPAPAQIAGDHENPHAQAQVPDQSPKCSDHWGGCTSG